MTWKAEVTEFPDWWRELLALPGVPDCKKLAQQVQASFSHPRRAKEMKATKYHCHAPLPHHVSLETVSSHLLIPSLLVGISEIWREKTIAYTHALQYWVEKSSLPAGGQPHRLAESVKELREEMRCYLPSTDQEVFEGVTPLEGTPTGLAEESQPPSETAPLVLTPKELTAKETIQELA